MLFHIWQTQQQQISLYKNNFKKGAFVALHISTNKLMNKKIIIVSPGYLHAAKKELKKYSFSI